MKKIIFVCHGSICRSPAAEFIAKQYLKQLNKENEYEITSRALTHEEIGNDLYTPMRATLIDYKIPFSHHSSTFINKEDIDSCDYLFYMDDDNYNLLINLFGENKKFLPIFAFSKQYKEIEDPWYTGRYTKVVNQIIQCIEDIFKNI